MLRAIALAPLCVLAAFGVLFSFANYPWFATAVTLVFLVLVGISAADRRKRRAARDEARARAREGFTARW